jgi:hypothetical protein
MNWNDMSSYNIPWIDHYSSSLRRKPMNITEQLNISEGPARCRILEELATARLVEGCK